MQYLGETPRQFCAAKLKARHHAECLEVDSKMGNVMAQLFEAPCYKPEGRGFDC
jgi:hypothetical protein